MVDIHIRKVKHVQHGIVIALRPFVQFLAVLLVCVVVNVNQICRLDKPVRLARRIVKRQREIERVAFR